MAQHPPYIPHTHFPPTDFPDTGGESMENITAYIETAMPPPSIPQPTANDVAGVLRRNQACLACRRRKLKCDAQRPHCATCVRSYKHLLRTSPRSNPVLTCDYDDGNHEERGGSEDAEEGDEAGKKKRKNTGPQKRKKKDEEETEAEALKKKIEELELQLAQRANIVDSRPPQPAHQTPSKDFIPPQRSWQDSAPMQGESPTAFLEMLSSAASAQAQDVSAVPGLRNGASENTMMAGPSAFTPGSGLTPYLGDDWQNAGNEGVLPEGQAPGISAPAGNNESQHACQGIDNPSLDTTIGTTACGGFALSPSGVFNFSPGPSGPNVPGPTMSNGASASWFVSHEQPPMSDQLEPSTRVNGPWRGVETDSSIAAAASTQAGNVNSSILGQNMDLDGIDIGLEVDDAIQQQLFMDLFWPGWPPNLPEPNIVHDLVESFFDLVPNLPRLLHRARFLARLALPPTHSNFPHPALLHAICSSASTWCSPAIYEKSYSGKTGNGFDLKGAPKGSFGIQQSAFAKIAVQEGLDTGNRLFDVVRAMIILSRVFIDDTRMLECWAYCGLVARMILPLGLNVRSAELSLKSVMLPPPADALEREERRAAVWMALYHDTVASSASGWGTSMSLDELSIALPVSAKDFDLGQPDMASNPQDLDSSDLWTRHPVPDPFVMVIKATILLNRVTKFVRRWKNRHIRDDDDFDGLQKPEFRELANAIACLQMSFPANLRNPCKTNAKHRLDIDLIAAHLMPNAAIICLYEPFADVADPTCSSSRRILGAAQAIVSITQQVGSAVGGGASNFSAVMHSSASVCLVTAARTSLLFYRFALNVNDLVTAEAHRSDVEMIRMALGQYGLLFKIGHHHAQLLEYFMDRATNPSLEKLSAHYPAHPRPGAPELHANANFGICVNNALNIKRGFWRLPKASNSTGVSPLGSTPESGGYASNATAAHRSSSSGQGSSITRVDSDSSPQNLAGIPYESPSSIKLVDRPNYLWEPADARQQSGGEYHLDTDRVGNSVPIRSSNLGGNAIGGMYAETERIQMAWSRAFEDSAQIVDGQRKTFSFGEGAAVAAMNSEGGYGLTREKEKLFDDWGKVVNGQNVGVESMVSADGLFGKLNYRNTGPKP